MQVFTATLPDIEEALIVWGTGGVLGALDFGGYESRNRSVRRLITLAATRSGPLDFPPVYVNTGDRPCNPQAEHVDTTWSTLSFSTAGRAAMSLAEQVRAWSALIDLQARGWSARLKLLLHSGRCVLMHERPWAEWYFARLEPMVHFVPVREDLSDLLGRSRWVVEHPQEAAAIGRAGQAFAREHLTRDAAVERWSEVLRGVEPGRSPSPPNLRPQLDNVVRALRGS